MLTTAMASIRQLASHECEHCHVSYLTSESKRRTIAYTISRSRIFNMREYEMLKFPAWQQRTTTMLAEAMLDPCSRPYEVFYDTEGNFGLRCLS
jgi:hypothetical protein